MSRKKESLCETDNASSTVRNLTGRKAVHTHDRARASILGRGEKGSEPSVFHKGSRRRQQEKLLGIHGVSMLS